MDFNKCKLCGQNYRKEEMSDEHYPAKCVGNEDIVAFDFEKMLEMICSEKTFNEILLKVQKGKKINNITDELFDKELSKSLYPKGRTARTLCKKCNTFLGKYDETYLKFFNADGNPNKIKGFSVDTKYKIIKSIYAKFLSIPETENERFDFIDFIKNEKSKDYTGGWYLYFIKRDYSTDLLGFKDIRTGKLVFDEGVVYELSDEKFIFNLMNFKKFSDFYMTNIFDILEKNYNLIEGVGENGGYHGQIMLTNFFLDNEKDLEA